MPEPRFRRVVFPGRHHAITRFQVGYLTGLAKGATLADVDGNPVTIEANPDIVWAVTSADHDNTRRNPLAMWERASQIALVTATMPGIHRVVPVPNLASSPRFARYTLTVAATALDADIDPTNTVIACSTPSLIDQYRSAGYQVIGVEAVNGTIVATLPFQLVEAAAAEDRATFDAAAPAVIEFWDRYRLHERVIGLFADPLVGADSDLTEHRDYNTYARSFDDAAARKWAQIADVVRPGRIVDIGCAAGGMLEQAASDPRLVDSDLHGIEVARPLYAAAVARQAAGTFGDRNVFFHHRNVITRPLFGDNSIDTVITAALTHEVISYGAPGDLDALAAAIFAQLRPGGRWVNLDVCGPADADRPVVLHLPGGGARDDGRELTGRDRDWLAGLGPVGRFEVFARTFRAGEHEPFDHRWLARTGDGGRVAVTLRAAMEFMSKKDYLDSWQSEMHERFCTFTAADWTTFARRHRFDVAPASASWCNPWLVTNRFAGYALTTADGVPIDWPDTNMLLVAVKPLAC